MINPLQQSGIPIFIFFYSSGSQVGDNFAFTPPKGHSVVSWNFLLLQLGVGEEDVLLASGG